MPQNRRIYLLDPKKLSPETIAVTFAKTSRSPLPFDAIADELSDAASANFHEKWVVGYGHSSVAEHAVLHIAVENISRLAVECLESNRLASYTEKSSRYQVWDSEHFYIPDEFNKPEAVDLYRRTCVKLFGAYQKTYSAVSAHLSGELQHGEKESKKGFETRVRSAAADVCRYLLPACSLANVGITINARALEHAITKMLSHPLLEVRAIGSEIKENTIKHVPTMVKYANKNQYLSWLNDHKCSAVKSEGKPDGSPDSWCDCINFDKEGENKILAAFMYRFGDFSMRDALEHVRSLSLEQRQNIAKQLTARMGEHDLPPREFEYGAVTFDILLDQGAYFELKRHRMMTQTAQRFTPYYGYALPKLIEQVGLVSLYKEMMSLAREAYLQLAKTNETAAAYVLPNAFNRRVLLEMNLRSAIHLIKLRCAENAHFGLRRPTLRVAELLMDRFPIFADMLAPCTSETWKMVEKEHFTQTLVV